MILFKSINENNEIFKEWVNKGAISCSLPFYWEIYAWYDIYKKNGDSETMSRFKAAEKFGVSEMTICRVIRKMES